MEQLTRKKKQYLRVSKWLDENINPIPVSKHYPAISPTSGIEFLDFHFLPTIKAIVQTIDRDVFKHLKEESKNQFQLNISNEPVFRIRTVNKVIDSRASMTASSYKYLREELNLENYLFDYITQWIVDRNKEFTLKEPIKFLL